jgi:hypothetical protein
MISLTSEAVVETDAPVTPETMCLVERAERVRMDAIRLCQETDETLREMKSLRVEAAWLTSERGRESIGLEGRVRRSALIRRGASPVNDLSSERLATLGRMARGRGGTDWGWFSADGWTHGASGVSSISRVLTHE